PNGNGRVEGNATGYNGNQIRYYNCRGVGHFPRNCTVRPRRRDAAYLQTQLLIAQKEEARIQLQSEEFDLMAAAADLNEIEDFNANCILMANLQQASTSGTQADKASIYDLDGSAEIRYYNCRGVGHFPRNCTVRPRRRDAAYLQTQLLIAQKEEARIQLQSEEFDLMAAAADLNEIEDFNANCILMANLQQASTSGTQADKASIYDLDGSAEVHNYEKCYDNEIFNMFTQKEQYTKLLEPIPEPHQVPHNDNNVISEDSSIEQSGGIVEQYPVNVEETRALYD
nr:hypothetical protein [Tanacetum cinerariifolium]